MCERWIGTLHSPRPQPSDYLQLPPFVRPQIWAFPNQFGRNFNLRVKVPNPFLGLGPHPPAVVADVFGQALHSAPSPGYDCPVIPGLRIHRWLTRKPRWYFDHRFVNQHRHRIQITSVGFETEALCFQWQSTAPGEWIMECR